MLDIPTLQTALQDARATGDESRQIVCHLAIGGQLLRKSNGTWAQEHFASALNLARKTSNRAMEGQALHGLAGALAMGGFRLQAADHFDCALAIARQLGDREGEAAILKSRDASMSRFAALAAEQPRPPSHTHTRPVPPRSDFRLHAYLSMERARPSGHRLRSPSPLWAWRCLRCPIDFFVSYRHADAAIYSARLCESLKARGLRVFFAPDLGIRAQHEAEADNDYRRYVESVLRPNISRAKSLLMIGGGSFLGSDWTKWETEIFEDGPDGKGREGKMLSVIAAELTVQESVMFWLKSRTDGIPIQDGREAWSAQTPSAFVADALEYHARRFDFELRAQLWLWLVPAVVRKRLFREPEPPSPASLQADASLDGEWLRAHLPTDAFMPGVGLLEAGTSEAATRRSPSK